MLAPDVPPAARVARAPIAIGVGEREYAIAIYRPRVHPGALRFTIRNLGEDVHDLVIRRAGKRIAALTAVVKPGATASLRLTLHRIGRYQLVCTIADHEARGMRATLRVVR
jgi:hypothetical protein